MKLSILSFDVLTYKSTHNVLEINDVSKIYTLNERYLRWKGIILFALESILNLVTFSMKVIFGKRELLVPVDPSKSSFEKFANG